MGAKKTPSTPTKKLSKDSAAKKIVTATSNNKKTLVAEKIAAALKKSQIAGDLKKNKSRDSSNNKKPSIVAKDAEKCNTKSSEILIKEPKKVNNVQKVADKSKLPIKKTKSKIKISNELKNLAIDGIQKEISSGMKTSICEMVKLKKQARPNPNANNSIIKGKETQDSKKVITVELKNADEIINGVKVIKKIINTASKINDNESKKVEVKKPNDDIKKSEVKKAIEKSVEVKKSADDAKKVDVKKVTEKVSEPKKLVEKSKEAKKVVENVKKVETKSEDVKKAPGDPKKIPEKKVESPKKADAKKSIEKLSDTKISKDDTKNSVNDIKKSPDTKKLPETPKKSQSDTASKKMPPPKKSNPNSSVKQIKIPISSPNQKEKVKTIKKEVNNQSSVKSKVNNDEKVPITKYNESKVDNKGKNKIEHAITSPTKVNVLVGASAKKPSPKAKTKPIEKDPLKISSSSSDESENEKDSDKIFKKPAKPKAKPAVRALKIVKRITSIKKSRVASLNAIAKVHCLYENEARVQHLDHSSGVTKLVKKPPSIVSVCNVSSEDDDDDEDEDDEDSKELLVKRSLRTAPGLRAVGKHWEMDSMSSEIDTDDDDNDDESRKNAKDDAKAKSIKLKNQQQKSKQLSKLKNQIKKSLKQAHSVKQIRSSVDSRREREGELDGDKKASKKKKQTQIVSSTKKSALIKKSNGSIKRKKTKDDDKSGDKNIVTKKRMASLNASAILAVNYEIENYAAKHESSSTETSDSSDNDEKDDIEPPTMKKEKKDVKMETAEEARPKSTTNLVKIDTDVTITGVYVNTALVSSQETICKTLKYRTAYSVTEECVVSRPPTQEPPKSYTPLSALTNMRPPGQQMQEQCMTSPSDQYQPHMPPQQHPPHQPQMYDPHMQGPMPPYPQYPPPSHSHPMPSTSSAFYPPQQVHRDQMAPALEHYDQTFTLSALLTSLTIFPVSLFVGVSGTISILITESFEMVNVVSQAYLRLLKRFAYLVIFGAFIGSIVFPLDWDRPWQAYPIPNIIGAITFQLISAFYTLFETMVKHKLGKKQH